MLRLSPMRPPIEPVLLLALLCTGPLLGFYADNPHEEIGPGEIAVYALGASLAAAAGFAVLCAVVRPKTGRLASLYASFIAFVFAYGGVSRAFASLGAGATLQRCGWLLLLPVALAPALWLGAHRGFRVFLFLFAASGVLLPSGRLLFRELPEPGPGLERTAAYPLADNGIWSGTAVRRPDVYAIVFDSYPNARVLREQYGMDNGPFLAALDMRGFEVARESYANFSETRLSIPTFFDMEYVFDASQTYGLRSGGAELSCPCRSC